MGWKPKEKILTAEEAIALAKTELKPYWFGVPPLLAGVRVQGRATAHPLDAKLSQQNWIMLFIDPTTYAGESALHVFKEWHRRYKAHELQFLLVLRFPSGDLYTRATVDDYLIQFHDLAFSVAIDPDGSLSEAFGTDVGPKLALLQKGKKSFELKGPTWAREGETMLQNFLRTTDPGLPLSPIFDPRTGMVMDHSIINFGTKVPPEISFEKQLPPVAPPGKILISGTWQTEAGRFTTSDPNAAIRFHAPGRYVALLAKPNKKTLETANILVQVNGMPAFENFYGAELARDDEGNTIVKTSNRWIYHVLSELPDSDRLITLKFPAAAKIPLALYGMRFGI